MILFIFIIDKRRPPAAANGRIGTKKAAMVAAYPT
jgi:hypothetical protein